MSASTHSQASSFILCALDTLKLHPQLVKAAYLRYRQVHPDYISVSVLEAIALYIKKRASDTINNLDMDEYCHWGHVCQLAKIEDTKARVRSHLSD